MRVVIADDDPSMLTRLKKAVQDLAAGLGVELYGEARNGQELIKIVEQQRA
ncbi:MAG: hypothetical protein MJK10_14305 [Pseudomonadales bacterium]|nr:hypothetical protein [Pseudomonadales bacterium]NRA17054.1 hypothetical protein [Oceanospirillaceae bacterium]